MGFISDNERTFLQNCCKENNSRGKLDHFAEFSCFLSAQGASECLGISNEYFAKSSPLALSPAGRCSSNEELSGLGTELTRPVDSSVSLGNQGSTDAGDAVAGSCRKPTLMTSRTRQSVVHFSAPFSLVGFDRDQPAGDYRVVYDEESIDGASWVAWHNVGTFLYLPAISAAASANQQMMPVSLADLEDALAKDKAQ